MLLNDVPIQVEGGKAQKLSAPRLKSDAVLPIHQVGVLSARVSCTEDVRPFTGTGWDIIVAHHQGRISKAGHVQYPAATMSVHLLVPQHLAVGREFRHKSASHPAHAGQL